MNELISGTHILKVNKTAPYVLLIEDDVDDQELLVEAFEAHAAEVTVETATNGKKAVTHLDGLTRAELPCLIVLDYNLPEADGAQVLEMLCSNPRYSTIPIVMWSTSNSPMYRQTCLDLGAKAFFVKPNDIKGIQELADEMLSFCTFA